VLFYLQTLPSALGILTVFAAVAGLVWLRGRSTWREPLLVWWVIVPTLFFTICR
jgi:hypothetical protein